jgi:integrase
MPQVGKVKQRGNGEGTIYRVNGRRKPWCATVSAGWRNGKLIRVARYAASEAEAKRLLRRLRAEHAPTRRDIPTVADHLEAWLLEVGRRRAPMTTATYRSAAETWIIPALGDVRIDDLTRGQVQRLIDDIAAVRRPATAQNVHHTIRAALSSAVRDELVPRNVAMLVQGPSSDHTPSAILDTASARRLVDSCEGVLRPLVTLALATGARKSELLGLLWADVGPEDIRIWQQLAWQDGEPVLRPPKTRASNRTVALPPFAATALTDWRRIQAREQLAAGPKWADRGLVFTDAHGEPLTPYAIRRAFSAALATAGVQRVTFHSLRHTFASLVVSATRDFKAAGAALGHSSAAMTGDVYAHLLPEQRRRAAEAIEEAFA